MCVQNLFTVKVALSPNEWSTRLTSASPHLQLPIVTAEAIGDSPRCFLQTGTLALLPDPKWNTDSCHPSLVILIINNKVLLYSTGNYIQYPEISHNSKENKKECVYICVCSLVKSCQLFVTPWTAARQTFIYISSVQLPSRVQLFATPWIAARQASLSITNSQSSLKLMSIELVMPSRHFILCRPLLLLPPIPPSIRDFSNESALHIRWPKYWRYSFSISPSNEHPGLISFRMDWLDLLVVHGTIYI